MANATYEHIEDIFLEMIDMIRAPENLTVSEVAAKYRYIYSPGSYTGPWVNETVPYMVEPMDMFASRAIKGMVFVGPAQSGKTDALIINTTAYSVISDPMDMMLISPTKTAARDFSFRRLDRLHHHTKAVGEMLLSEKDADNTYDKRYKTGMILSITFPSPTELAGRPIGRVVLTDYDRMPLDVGGDGNPYDLASQRTNTFGSLAMTLAESSPSKPVLDPRWSPKTEHEAPPCEGIIELYNRGDRRRWYWPCPHCDQMFEGEFKYLVWNEEDKNGDEMGTLDKAETVRMACPHCGALIHPDERYEMNLWGEWLADGQYFDKKGRKRGKKPYNMTASFWLKGVAAAFTTWKKLVVEYLDAEAAYTRTGSEESLKKFYNNNLGEPYVPKSSKTLRTPEMLQSNAESLPVKEVPEGVRFIEAAVDVQANRFVVNVWGIMPGLPFDMIAIDRFELFHSERLDHNDNKMPLDPAAYPQDWDVLIDEVLNKQYPLSDQSGFMQVKLTLCDSGGKAGVTSNAYEFYRRLRKRNLHGRFVLVKGGSNRNAPRVNLSYPDSNRKDRNSGARGDVPVLLLNTEELKNNLDGRLSCTTPGSGMVRFPDWLPDEFFRELCAETRGDKGWENRSGERNEAWDLACYVIAGAISPFLLVEKMDWDNPPLWAAEWDKNNMISKDVMTPRQAAGISSQKYDLKSIGQKMRH